MQTRAAVLTESGVDGPYAESTPVHVREVELDGPRRGEVLVELTAAGVCHSDLSVVDGARPRPVPMVLGHEAAGVVAEVGEGVDDLEVGTVVGFSLVPACGRCDDCAAGWPTRCAPGNTANIDGTLLTGRRPFRVDGEEANHHLGVSGFAQHTVVARESLVVFDPDVPAGVASLFSCAVLTGVGAVVNTADVHPGESVAVFGLGGIGLSALMGATLLTADPLIAVDINPDRLAFAEKLGATHVIDASTNDPVEAIRDLTGGGVAHAFEAAGNAAVLHQAWESAGRGGAVVTVGLHPPDQSLELQAVGITTSEKSVRGSYVGSAVPQRDMPRFARLYQAGKLPVDELITDHIALDDINTAFDRLESGEQLRQIIDLGGDR